MFIKHAKLTKKAERTCVSAFLSFAFGLFVKAKLRVPVG